MKLTTIAMIASFACILNFVSCGIAETANQTKESVQESNEKQDQLIIIMKRMEELTKKMDQQMDKTNLGIDKTNEGMKTTNHGVHLQILTVALQQLLAKENTEQLAPPARMLPYAAVFAREASAEELLETFHTFYMDAVNGSNTAAEEPNEQDYRVQSRKISWAAGGLIAALASDTKFNEIQKMEVENPSRYQGTAKAFAVARYNMLKEAFLYSVRKDANAKNIGGIKVALGYFNSMKQISALPYVATKSFVVALPNWIVKKTEIVPDPSLPNVKKTVSEFLEKAVSVDPLEIKDLGSKTAQDFNIVKGEEAKKLLEQFN